MVEQVMMDPANLKALQAVVELLKNDPSLAHDPQLAFFKEFLTSWGAKVPPPAAKAAPAADQAPKAEPPKAPEAAAPEESEEEPEEPEEPEEEDKDRMAEDTEPFPSMAPSGTEELTDEQMDKQCAAKQAAAEAMEDGDLPKALEHFSAAIAIGGASAMMYTKRAEYLLKLKRPRACINDCAAALEINPDSGKAFRIRGKAHRFLGMWEEAHKDLTQGQQLDYDDDTVDLQKVVAEKMKKINEKKVKQRLRDEKKAVKERLRRKKEAQQAYEAAKAAEQDMGGMGGMGGMPGMPAGIDPSMLAGLMSDPELLQAFSNPKMMAAMQDIMQNPGNIGKYQSDPEVMALMTKVMGKLGGGMGGMPGGMGSAGPTFEEMPEDKDVHGVD